MAASPSGCAASSTCLRRDGCREIGSHHERASESGREVYDWVCEIIKLSDVSTHGWRVCYSERFLASISEEEKRYVVVSTRLNQVQAAARTSASPAAGATLSHRARCV